MGCSSGSSLEEKKFRKTGDPKKDFFYCFDDEEIKIIEEKKNRIIEISEEYGYMDLYSRFEIDYTKEKDDKLIVKQYLASYAKKTYTGDHSLDDIRYFNITDLEMISLKINNKESTLPVIHNQDNAWIYVGINFQISENHKEELFKDLLIIEITYKIKQHKVYNTRYIAICQEDDTYTSSLIVYYDKNKMEIEPENEVNLTSLKNGDKYFNQKSCRLWVRNKGKIKFSKEEESLIKKIFTSEEISNIYTALEKIGILKEKNLIFESYKYNFNKNGISKGEGKILYITNNRISDYIGGDDFNLNITELKINDKKIEKKPLDYEIDYENKKTESFYKSENGECSVTVEGLHSLVIIETKIEFIPPKNKDDSDYSFHFDLKYLFGLSYTIGGYYNFEIIPNNTQLTFEPNEEQYKPKKTRNLIIYSGFYDINLKEYDDGKYIEEMRKKIDNYDALNYDMEYRKREWLDKKLEEFHPLKFDII